jgi:hypothetical protein
LGLSLHCASNRCCSAHCANGAREADAGQLRQRSGQGVKDIISTPHSSPQDILFIFIIDLDFILFLYFIFPHFIYFYFYFGFRNSLRIALREWYCGGGVSSYASFSTLLSLAMHTAKIF